MGRDDGTRKKMNDAAKRRSQRNGTPASGVEVRSVLAGTIAYGLDEELSTIVRALAAAMAELPASAAARERIVAAMRAAERAGQLNRQLLAQAGRGRVEARPLDLNGLVREKVALLEPDRAPNVTVRLELADGLPALEGDAEQVQRAIGNLLTNAVEAIGEGPGEITVVTGTTVVRAAQGAQEAAHVAEAAQEAAQRAAHAGTQAADLSPGPGRYVVLRVSDDGCGMDDEVRKRLFAPFFSTRGVGRGLGMTAVLGAVRSQGGGVDVESRPGQGTTVSLFFPFDGDFSDADLPAGRGETKGSDGGGYCVLVIDDELDVREAVSDILTIKGMEVLAAADGKSGLQMYRKRQEDVDLVLLDLSMPKMGGEETCRRLREIDPGVRVLITSGYDQGGIDTPLKRLKPDGFLPKPYDMNKLVDAVFALLEERAAAANG